MKRIFGGIVAALALVVGSSIVVAPAHADTVTWSGELNVGEATWQRPQSNCMNIASVTEWYQTQSFSVDQDGSYTMEMIEMTGPTTPDGFFVLYEAPFDAATPLTNCLASNDDGGAGWAPLLTWSLTAGTVYTLVTTQCCDGTTADQVVAYTNQVSGPGIITMSQSGPTSTAVSATPVPGVAGEPIILGAAITNTGTGTGTGLPGTVEFFDDGTSLGVAPVDQTTGLASLSVALSEGAHEITAVYSGNAVASGSTSAPLALAVGAATVDPPPAQPTPPALIDTAAA